MSRDSLQRPCSVSDDSDLLGRWHRERGFGSSPAGSSTSNGGWRRSITMDGSKPIRTGYNKTCRIPVTGTGHEIIEVLESADGLAKFRHYIVNPVVSDCHGSRCRSSRLSIGARCRA